MMDKKTAIAAALLLALASCSSGTKQDEKNAPSAKEVVDKYVETVTTAKPQAEAAIKATEERAEEQKKMIEQADK